MATPRALLILAACASALGGASAEAGWIAGVAGPCRARRGCVQSAGYDEKPRKYGDEESCVITTRSSVTVSAISFASEKNYDTLEVGGLMYSGKITKGPQDVSLEAGSSITWSTDSGTANGGWKLCPSHLVEQERELEPAMQVEGLEMFCYAFMTVTIVWMCPFTLLIPMVLTLFFLAIKQKKAASRVARTPLILFEGCECDAAKDPDVDNASWLIIVLQCAAFWGLCSLAIVMSVIIFFAGIALGFIYVLGLSVMLAVLLLLNIMERVAKRGLKDSVNNKLEDNAGSLSMTQRSTEGMKSQTAKKVDMWVVVLDSFRCQSPDGVYISVQPDWRGRVTQEHENGDWTVVFSLPQVGERLVSATDMEKLEKEFFLWTFMSKPWVKFSYRLLFVLIAAFVTSVALFLQFIVDAMLVEAGMELLPARSEGSDTPPVFSVATNMEDSFFVMELIVPILNWFKPILKWFHSWLDWPLACSPASWAAYSSLCMSTAFIGYLWATTDIAAPLYDRQKRIENAETSDEAGTMGFLFQKLCGGGVMIILKMNFYLLQMCAQSILSGFVPMMSHSSMSCDVSAEHPVGVEIGYSFAWLLACFARYYGFYVLFSAFLFLVTGVHYDQGQYTLMSRLTSTGYESRRQYVFELNKVVRGILPAFLQGALLLFPQPLGREVREGLVKEINKACSQRDAISEVVEYHKKALEGGCALSTRRFFLGLSVFPATFGFHSDRTGFTAYLMRARCLVWGTDANSAQPENIQLATGKVLALSFSSVPGLGVAWAKLMEYNNDAAAWLWTKEYSLQSRIETTFVLDWAEKKMHPDYDEQYPLAPWLTCYKFQDYCRWITMFILSMLVLTTAVEPTEQKLVLVFTIILILQCLDAVWQLYNKYRADRNKERRMVRVHNIIDIENE